MFKSVLTICSLPSLVVTYARKEERGRKRKKEKKKKALDRSWKRSYPLPPLWLRIFSKISRPSLRNAKKKKKKSIDPEGYLEQRFSVCVVASLSCNKISCNRISRVKRSIMRDSVERRGGGKSFPNARTDFNRFSIFPRKSFFFSIFLCPVFSVSISCFFFSRGGFFLPLCFCRNNDGLIFVTMLSRREYHRVESFERFDRFFIVISTSAKITLTFSYLSNPNWI